MTHVIDLYGVYLPVLLPLAVLALAVLRLLTGVLAARGFYRLVWHRPLFDLALYVALLALCDLLFRWMTR